jgi:hypothetical protein
MELNKLVNKPKYKISFRGTVENEVKPATAKLNILENPNFVSPLYLSSPSYSIKGCLNQNQVTNPRINLLVSYIFSNSSFVNLIFNN